MNISFLSCDNCFKKLITFFIRNSGKQEYALYRAECPFCGYDNLYKINNTVMMGPVSEEDSNNPTIITDIEINKDYNRIHLKV